MKILGYQRTLQVTDLWKLDPSRESGFLSVKLDSAWARRNRVAEEWNQRLAKGEVKPGLYRRLKWRVKALSGKGGETSYSERRNSLEKEWREVSGRIEPSLAWSLNDIFGWHFWAGGLFKVRLYIYYDYAQYKHDM